MIGLETLNRWLAEAPENEPRYARYLPFWA